MFAQPLTCFTKACRRTGVAVAIVAACVPVLRAAGTIIDSSAFFAPLPHEFVSFELDGAGNPINLLQGQTRLMPAGEYATIGLVFDPAIRWVNDSTPAFDAAQAIAGSPSTAIPSSAVSTFSLVFSTPVQSFGMAVINNSTFDPLGPRFDAYDAQGQLIESVQFGGTLVDGAVVVPNLIAEYGFMGLHTDRDIARVVVTKRAAILDDLRFSALPSPGAAGLLIGSLLAASRRRRH